MNGTDFSSKVILALSEVEELGNKKKLAVIENVPDLSELFENKATLEKLIGSAKAEEFYGKFEGVDALIDNLDKREINYVTCLDDDYPRLLSEIEDRPALLYFKGSLGALRRKTVGVVGSRKPTRYGLKVAEEFSRELARAGVTIVSGFARGVDIAAHLAAINEEAPTVAVFGSGIDVCYPAEHRGYIDKIVDCGGLILSEYPLGSRALQYHFPERNRIISGVSLGVLLAEATKKSGSLITMRMAIEQNREIYVVPGNVFAQECEGGNLLLRQMPHSLVISPEDVLSSLGISVSKGKSEETVELSIEESRVIEALRGGELHFEELLAETSLSPAELTGILMSLTLSGLVDDVGSNYFALH